MQQGLVGHFLGRPKREPTHECTPQFNFSGLEFRSALLIASGRRPVQAPARPRRGSGHPRLGLTYGRRFSIWLRTHSCSTAHFHFTAPHHDQSIWLAICRGDSSAGLAVSRWKFLGGWLDLRGRTSLHHRPASVDRRSRVPRITGLTQTAPRR